MVEASADTMVLRRFAGPAAEESTLVCLPPGNLRETTSQAEAAYRALLAALTVQRASFCDVASETLFLRDIRRDLPLVLDRRAQLLAEVGQSAEAPQPTVIQQAPLDQDGVSFALMAATVVPRQRDTWSVHDIPATPSCTCAGCVGSAARVIRLGDQSSLHTSNVYGVGTDPTAQALDMFRAAERLLNQCGMEFRDVVRTWIYLRDIERDYDALNHARRRFFGHCGIELRPASTGVQGIPFPEAHDFSINLYAVRSAHPLDVTSLSTPSLNEAWSYGADFSRGLRITEANKRAIHVSGTASIDDTGQTIHTGNFPAQAERMLHNIESLLGRQGASFADVFSAIAYLKNPSDVPALRAIFRARGFDGFPCSVVEAPLCRPDLLCETEAVALLPLAAATT